MEPEICISEQFLGNSKHWFRDHTLRARIWRRLLENTGQFLQYVTVIYKKLMSLQSSTHTAIHDLGHCPPCYSLTSTPHPAHFSTTTVALLLVFQMPDTFLPHSVCTMFPVPRIVLPQNIPVNSLPSTSKPLLKHHL